MSQGPCRLTNRQRPCWQPALLAETLLAETVLAASWEPVTDLAGCQPEHYGEQHSAAAVPSTLEVLPLYGGPVSYVPQLD
jgi:hypothetical protein